MCYLGLAALHLWPLLPPHRPLYRGTDKGRQDSVECLPGLGVVQSLARNVAVTVCREQGGHVTPRQERSLEPPALCRGEGRPAATTAQEQLARPPSCPDRGAAPQSPGAGCIQSTPLKGRPRPPRDLSLLPWARL